MSDDDVLEACLQHGASRVFFAVYSHMLGDDTALRAVGLPNVVDLDQADAIGRVAYSLLTSENQAAELADSVVRRTRSD